MNALSVAIWIVIFVIFIAIYWWISGVYNVRNPQPVEPRYSYAYLERQFSSIPDKLWFRDDPCIFDKYLGCKCEEYTVIASDYSVVYNNSKAQKKTYTSTTESCCPDADKCFSSPGLPVKKIPNTFEVTSAVVTGVGRTIRINKDCKKEDKCNIEVEGKAPCGRRQNLAVRVTNGDIIRVVHISKSVIGQCDCSY